MYVFIILPQFPLINFYMAKRMLLLHRNWVEQCIHLNYRTRSNTMLKVIVILTNCNFKSYLFSGCYKLFHSYILHYFTGKRRYDRKQSGYGGQSKPVFRKKVFILSVIVVTWLLYKFFVILLGFFTETFNATNLIWSGFLKSFNSKG